MLKTLSVQNFALIEKVDLEFGEGLNILTGETGAGKSILIDALGAVLGQRVGISNIRAGCEELRVEAVFLLEKFSPVREVMKEFEIEIDDDNLIIARKISRAGKNIIVANGSHLTLTALKKLGASLVNVHGQNENLALLKESSVYNLIDGEDEKISSTHGEYQKLFRLWQTQIKSLQEKQKNKVENNQRLDMLKWQEQEISDADLKVGEDEELEIEIKKLSNAEKISENLSEAYQLLGGGNDFDILTALAKVEKNLAEVSKFDDKLNSAQKLLDDATISLREVFDEVQDYSASVEFSPERLDQLHARLDIIRNLKKKYGETIEKILERLEKIREEISQTENLDSDFETTKQLILKLEAQTKKRAATLLKLRQQSAEKLSSAIEKEIRKLGMEKAKFKIAVEPVEELNLRGGDSAEMFFSANVGEEMKTLSKSLSR